MSSKEDFSKPLSEVGDTEPKCMIVFSWLIISFGNNVYFGNIIISLSGSPRSAHVGSCGADYGRIDH